MERAAERRLDRCHGQIDLLARQADEARSERDTLDARLPRGGGPLVARLQAAEKSLARLEDLLPLEAQRESAWREAESLRGQFRALRARAREARSRWRQLLSENQLPADWTPAQLKSFAANRGELAGLAQALADKQAELARRRAEHDTLAGRIAQLIEQSAIVPNSKRPLDQLQQCLAQLADQQSLVRQRAELLQKIARLRRRWRRTVARRNELHRRRTRLLRAAGTLDEVEFRRRAALAADASRLRSEHAQLDREISSALSSFTDAPQIAIWLDADEELAATESRVADNRRAAADRLSEAHRHQGELGHRLNLMAEDHRLADKRIELDIVERRLSEALRRWRVLAVCGLLMDAVREQYEREHQPQALRAASIYLERLTGGRYPRVWTRLGEHVLRVDDDEGRSLPIEVLSSGAREQLFLALRFALAGSYARRGIELPLVLDDVLVNFDAARAKAAAGVLRDFAKDGHQVVLFTCHEHIARLFKSIKAEVRQLPDHAYGGAAPADSAEKPRSRRRPAPRQEPPDELPIEIDVQPRESLPTPAAKTARQIRWAAEEFAGELADRVREDAPEGDRGEADDTQAA
jgi:uncharacterized protein YhaN